MVLALNLFDDGIILVCWNKIIIPRIIFFKVFFVCYLGNEFLINFTYENLYIFKSREHKILYQMSISACTTVCKFIFIEKTKYCYL